MNARLEGLGITPQVLLDVFDTPVSFHRCLVPVTGGVTSALMLSQAIWTTQSLEPCADGWFIRSQEQWTQETARRDLVRTGLWEECLRGIPPSLVARIRLDCLLALLTDDASAARSLGSRIAEPDRGVAADKGSPNVESRLRQPRSLVSPKPPDQFRPIRQHGSAESAVLLMNHSTGESLQPQHTASSANPPDTEAGGELIFPEQMLPDERQAARLLLRRCGDQAQCLLDELAGRLQVRGVRLSPVAYLRGLIARAAAGSFVPELGPRVAAEREQRQKYAIRRREREAEEQRLAAERATPEYQAKALAQRQKVRQMIDELKARMGTNRRP